MTTLVYLGLGLVVAVVAVVAALWWARQRVGSQILSYATVTGALIVLGISWLKFTAPSPQDFIITVPHMIGYYTLAVAGGAVFFGIIEFGLLRFIGLFRLGAITRV